MAKQKTQFTSKTINLKALCEKAKINYHRLYWRTKGDPKGQLPLIDRTKVANALVKDITPFLSDLGFDVSITQKEG